MIVKNFQFAQDIILINASDTWTTDKNFALYPWRKILPSEERFQNFELCLLFAWVNLVSG
jgi:hypothetical protein